MGQIMQAPATAQATGALSRSSAGSPSQYLTFSLGGEMFAVGILNVKEIIEYGHLTPIPMMPPFIRGVINLRGSVVPVIDLAARFGGRPTEVGKRTCIVIVEVQHEGSTHILGLLVDGVNAVMEIGADSIEPAPAFGTRVNTEFIAGMARVDGRFVIILDIARVLSIEEMAAIRSVGNNPNSGENHVD